MIHQLGKYQTSFLLHEQYGTATLQKLYFLYRTQEISMLISYKHHVDGLV